MQLATMQSSMGGQALTMRRSPAQPSRTTFHCVARKQLTPKESRIGKALIPVPQGVTVTIDGQNVAVKGPRGELSATISALLDINQADGNLRISKNTESRTANELHGLWRSLTYNMVVGTSVGFTKVLTLIGVGYRASMADSTLTMNLGFSHPVVIDVPKEITVLVDKNTTVTITGNDKALVGDFAAKVRAWRPPEPYKGKGVRYVDEVVRKKEGKRGK